MYSNGYVFNGIIEKKVWEDCFQGYDYYMLDDLLKDDYFLVCDVVCIWVKQEVSFIIEEYVECVECF